MIGSAIALTAIFAVSALITPGEAWPQSDWKEAKTLKNPVKSIGDAKNAIAINCAGCHGASGRGDGVASAALQPKPMDWSSPAVHSERIRNTKALRVEDAEGQAVGAPANPSVRPGRAPVEERESERSHRDRLRGRVILGRGAVGVEEGSGSGGRGGTGGGGGGRWRSGPVQRLASADITSLAAEGQSPGGRSGSFLTTRGRSFADGHRPSAEENHPPEQLLRLIPGTWRSGSPMAHLLLPLFAVGGPR